ncbi:MAG TPA: diaminopropionate ammonia-lyase [Acidimicrobiia bacterium]|jgi:diaminopropionate ammonia-lyase
MSAVAPQVFVNPARRPDPVAPRPDGRPSDFHRRLPGYVATPLIDAPEIARQLGLARVSVKDESSRLGLPAFKVLGASWAVYRLLSERLGSEPEWHDLEQLRTAFAPLADLTLVAATDGNHGRAVARVARLLGLGARIFVPAGTAAARVAGIASEGALVIAVDGTYEDAVDASAAEANAATLLVSDTTPPDAPWDTARTVIEGYETIFAEVDAQVDTIAGATPIDLVVAPMGVGALAAAAVAHYATESLMVAVEPTNAASGMRSAEAGHPVLLPGPHDSIMAGLNCGSVSMVAWPALQSGIDVFVTVDDARAERAMRELATIGIVAGETGAASLAGLRALADAADLRGRHALVIVTEGATDPDAYERIVGHAP